MRQWVLLGVAACVVAVSWASPANIAQRVRRADGAVFLQHRQSTGAPVLCGVANITCSIHGDCRYDSRINDSVCVCDQGYRGLSCDQRYLMDRTMEGQRRNSSAVGYRYLLHTDPEAADKAMTGRELHSVSLLACLQMCEEEASFICEAAVFFPHTADTTTSDGECVYVDKRYVTSTSVWCVSYSRGPEECYYGDGLSYRGSANTTVSNHTCQRWDVQDPHSHSRLNGSYPAAGLQENFCRNPDGEAGPWCYTVDGDRWELCAVPACTPYVPPSPSPSPIPDCPIGCTLHGTCDATTGRCLCFPGFLPGPHGNCDEPVSCPRNCSGHGSCEMGGLCRCDPGWDGGYGDCRARSVQCPLQCSGHGECDGINGVCVCLTAWRGPACNISVYFCPNNCSGNGICDPQTVSCSCDPLYTGADCSEFLCPEACNSRGVCHGDTRLCECEEGFTGESCDLVIQPPCPNDCNGNGNCVGGKCFCKKGWLMADCSKFEAVACPNDCMGHGSCNDGVCLCDKHYSGVNCGVYTAPHYEPWPVAALIIPAFLAAGFLLWLGFICYKVDIADGTSDFAQLPVIRWMFQNRMRQTEIVEGKVSKSRLKRVYYD